MFEQGVFDLWRTHVVACRDDHVVIACLVEKVTVGILHEGVAGVVPAVLDVAGLAGVVQVFAACRALHGKFADGATRNFMALLVHDFGGVAGHHFANGSAPHIAWHGGDEDMKHLGGTDAVEQVDAGGVFPELARGVRQGFTCAHAQPQRGQAMLFCIGCHLPVERGCGVANGGALVVDQLDHGLGRVGDRREIHRGTCCKRKQQHAAQAKGKGQRGRAHHDVLRGRPQNMAGPGLAGGQYIAVRVYGGFGFASGA